MLYNFIVKRKVLKAIPFIVLLLIVSVLAIFYKFIDKRAYSMFYNNFNLVFSKNQLAVHYVYVGQGDGIAINLPNNKILLIDAGPSSSASKLKKYINSNVLSGFSGKKIDYLLLTHADADHVGGALNLLKSFDVGFVFLPKVDKDTQTYNEIVEYLNNKNIKNSTDYEQLEEEDIIDVFTLNETFKETNDNCPIIKITYCGYSFLFTGDIPSYVEQKFVAAFKTDLDSDVLKVAHHGSATSSCNEFINAVSPAYAVISCGIDNQHHHPDTNTEKRLTNAGATVLRTDVLGNIMFVLGNKYAFGYLHGDYTSLNYEFYFLPLALVVDGVLVVTIILVLVSKQKSKKRKNA